MKNLVARPGRRATGVSRQLVAETTWRFGYAWRHKPPAGMFDYPRADPSLAKARSFSICCSVGLGPTRRLVVRTPCRWEIRDPAAGSQPAHRPGPTGTRRKACLRSGHGTQRVDCVWNPIAPPGFSAPRRERSPFQLWNLGLPLGATSARRAGRRSARALWLGCGCGRRWKRCLSRRRGC